MLKVHPLFAIAFFLHQSCGQKFSYYEGYVYGKADRNPVKNLGVKLQFSKKIDTYTNGDGYFKIPAKPDLLENIYLLNEGKLVDSITPVLDHAGEQFGFQFVDGRQDTLFIALP